MLIVTLIGSIVYYSLSYSNC